MSLGNVPPDMLAGAVEKLLAKMDEADLAALYQRELSTMPSNVLTALVQSLFAAFHERGESSEDAAEGAGTTVDAIGGRETGSVSALLSYARKNPALLKEATTIFVEQHPEMVVTLPAVLRDALAQELTRSH